MRKVTECSYTCADSGIRWHICMNDNMAQIERSAGKSENTVCTDEKKLMEQAALSNLDIFFNTIDFDAFCKEADGGEGDIIELSFGDEEYVFVKSSSLSECHKAVFVDLLRYFNAYFDGTFSTYKLTEHSFDGGGPIYSIEMEKSGIFTWYSKRSYNNPDHESLCGSGYDVHFVFYPLRAGQASAVLIGSSPICPKPDVKLTAAVDDSLTLTMEVEAPTGML